MFVDSHCHFHLLEDNADTDRALAAALDEGVEHFLNVAIDVESRDALIALAERHTEISTSIGVHPSGTGEDPDEETLAALADHPLIVAVGETGLDYAYNEDRPEWQRERFRRHVRAARLIGKPVIVHTRAAPQDTLAILREEGAREVGGIIHCFTEDWPTARAMLDEGFHISLSGIVTFRNADALRGTAAHIPGDRLLIETDCPYLAPVPHRGRENQPAYVRHVAECLAEVRGESVEEVAAVTSENFYRLFPQTRPAHASA
ncbi:TatD family hydrolase [Arhodomonas aquaeolei]|uniref:TatD family hydrolase n=1 Tax=Arhodomonas aquaeolei TaxID=2369 RepID=UPI00037A7340|nr:TatD family hydrolase [Arhodomonas aquaeolei]